MNVQEFAKETLLQVIRGVQEANDDISQELKNSGVKIGDSTVGGDPVDSDIALVATDNSGVSGGVQIAVFGGRAEQASSETSTSRIKFTVPVLLPYGR